MMKVRGQYNKMGIGHSLKMNKKAAFELSMTTVVIIVLAMVMLALGLTLVKTIFSGAVYTATSLNDQVKNEINKMFEQGGTNVGIISESGKLEPSRGKDNCVWWAILAEQAASYGYSFKVSPEKCTQEGLTQQEIETWFTGLTGGPTTMAANQKDNKCLLLTPPKNAPSCVFTLNLAVTKGNAPYGSASVYIRPKAGTLFG